MAAPGLVLALDVGTSSVRTALFTGRGKRISASTGQRAYRLRTSEPGMAELAPGTLWAAARASLAETLDYYAERPTLRRAPIVAVGASCFWHSLLGVDARARPRTPIYTWADARCLPWAERLRERLDPRDVHRRTGCMLHTSYWPAKLRWLREGDRARFRGVSFWISPVEWLFWRLAGIRACAHAMATGTGLYDPSRQDWDDLLLDACRVRRDQLLPLTDAPLGPARTYRSRLGPLSEAAWCAGIGDGAAGNLGSGAVEPRTVAINLGSSAAVRVVRQGRRASAPFGLFAYRVDRRRYVVGGAISNAGNLRTWCLRELDVGDDESAVERALARRAAPEHGLTVLPFWTAERAPTWRADMTGCIRGLRQSTTALDILQAVTEAGYHRLAQILHRLPRPRDGWRIIVSGGASRSSPALQRLANVLGEDVHACREPEASVRGAAVDALIKLGRCVPPPRTGRHVTVDADLARRFAAERDRQQALEEAMYPA